MQEPKIDPNLVIVRPPVILKENKSKPEQPKKVYCKYCRHKDGDLNFCCLTKRNEYTGQIISFGDIDNNINGECPNYEAVRVIPIIIILLALLTFVSFCVYIVT